MTPKQANEKKNYEVLEFFGDGMLKYLTSDFLFLRHPSDSEGQLTSKYVGFCL